MGTADCDRSRRCRGAGWGYERGSVRTTPRTGPRQRTETGTVCLSPTSICWRAPASQVAHHAGRWQASAQEWSFPAGFIGTLLIYVGLDRLTRIDNPWSWVERLSWLFTIV